MFESACFVRGDDLRARSRPLRRRHGSVLGAVTQILCRRAEPMRVREIHAEVERAYRSAVPFSSVNEALSTHATGEQNRFRRVRCGIYEMRA
jgi:hypothetical protein